MTGLDGQRSRETANVMSANELVAVAGNYYVAKRYEYRPYG
jgi:hypothetical protein